MIYSKAAPFHIVEIEKVLGRRLERITASHPVRKFGSEFSMTGVVELPGEFHPQAFPEPCMNLSVHTAPDVRPLP